MYLAKFVYLRVLMEFGVLVEWQRWPAPSWTLARSLARTSRLSQVSLASVCVGGVSFRSCLVKDKDKDKDKHRQAFCG